MKRIFQIASLGILLFNPLVFAVDAPEVLLSQKCKKMYNKNRENICFCVLTNLKQQLNSAQLQTLARVYMDRHSRMKASESLAERPLLDVDYEVHKNCSQNHRWKFMKEDLGQPDALED